jgi:hypothetical protein
VRTRRCQVVQRGRKLPSMGLLSPRAPPDLSFFLPSPVSALGNYCCEAPVGQDETVYVLCATRTWRRPWGRKCSKQKISRLPARSRKAATFYRADVANQRSTCWFSRLPKAHSDYRFTPSASGRVDSPISRQSSFSKTGSGCRSGHGPWLCGRTPVRSRLVSRRDGRPG